MKLVPLPVAAWDLYFVSISLAEKSDPPKKAQDDRGLARIILIPPG